MECAQQFYRSSYKNRNLLNKCSLLCFIHIRCSIVSLNLSSYRKLKKSILSSSSNLLLWIQYLVICIQTFRTSKTFPRVKSHTVYFLVNIDIWMVLPLNYSFIPVLHTCNTSGTISGVCIPVCLYWLLPLGHIPLLGSFISKSAITYTVNGRWMFSLLPIMHNDLITPT